MKDKTKLRASYVGFFHETNTYLTEGMGETTLERMRTFRGNEIKALRGTAIGGPVDVCEEKGWELLPGVMFYIDWCFSTVSDQCWKDAKKEIIDTLRIQLWFATLKMIYVWTAPPCVTKGTLHGQHLLSYSILGYQR
jgi:microcystin degradation protein MlrC